MTLTANWSFPTAIRFGAGRILILLPRGEYWQAGYVIPKGGDAQLRQRSFAEFQAELTRLVPEIAGPVAGLSGWDAVKLLTVRVDRLHQVDLDPVQFGDDLVDVLAFALERSGGGRAKQVHPQRTESGLVGRTHSDR